MKIRKQYKFEASHRVMNCASTRCSQNIHGHSFIVEVILESGTLDNGDMVMDFGLLKPTVGKLFDWLDHSIMVWSHDDDVMALANTINERVVYMPFNTTAENLSKMFFMCISNILSQTEFKNGETDVTVHAVRVHETATGYAECNDSDIQVTDWKKVNQLDFAHVDPKDAILRVINEEWRFDNPEVIND